MLFDLCTCTFSEWDDEGFLQLQRDPQGDGSASPAEACHTYGFLGRPCDPGDDKIGCNLLIGRVGSEHFAWAQHDPRSTEWLPRVTAGGSAQYGGQVGRALSWRLVDGDTGTVTDYIPVSWSGSGTCTKAHKIEAGVDSNGAPVVQVIHADGMALVMFDGAVTMVDATGTGFVSIKDGKVNVSGSLKATSGLDVGGVGGVEVPLHPLLAAAVAAHAVSVTAACGALSSASSAAIDPALKAAIPAFCAALTASVAALQIAVTAGKSTMLKTL